MGENVLLNLMLFVFIGGASFAGGYLVSRIFKGRQLKQIEGEAASLRELAQREADTLKKEAELHAKDTMLKLRQEFETETKQRREELSSTERRLLQKEDNVEKRLDLLDKKEKDQTTRLETLKQKEAENAQKADELS